MSKIKVGVVGIRRGGAYVKAFHRSDRSEITAICDLSDANLAASAEEIGLNDNQCFKDYDKFLETDINVVVVGTPIPFHEEQVIKALKAGKHVFSEVTMANSIEGCQKILETVKTTGMKYMLAENYIYLDFIQQWKKYIDDGRIGRIHYAEAEYVHDIRERLYDTGTRPGESYWRTYRPPIHYCTHSLGPLMFLIGNGDRICKATAWGNKASIVENPALYPSTIDMQAALFETEQGRIIKILRSQVTPREKHIITYNVYGTEGFLETGRTAGYNTVGTRFFGATDKAAIPMNCNGTNLDTPKRLRFGGHGTSDYYGAMAFLDYIEYDKKPFATVEVAAQLTLPGLIAHECAMQEHVWKEVPKLD